MANRDIIFRINEELDAFERNERSADQLERLLFAHFEALEGITYSELKLLHHFEARFVRSQFSDEDPRIETRETVLSELRTKLATIENQKNDIRQNRKD